MYICSVCESPIESGIQFATVFGKHICVDCAVRKTIDDVMAVFNIDYAIVPEELEIDGVVVYDDNDSVASAEQVENFFHSENPVFVPTQVGEKNTVLTTLSVTAEIGEIHYRKAWVYESARDAEYWAEHYLKNMPNLISIDGIVSEEKIPEGYDIYRVDDDSGNSEDCSEKLGVTSEQTGLIDPQPNGVIKNCKYFPCDKCRFYYGEIHECVFGEEGIEYTDEEKAYLAELEELNNSKDTIV